MEEKMSSGTGWSEVWNSKPSDQADWNGFESCFKDRSQYDAYTKAMIAFVLDTLEVNPEDIVGDLGCGSGIAATAIAERAAKVRAFDYSEVALDIARRRPSRGNVDYEWADLNVIDLTKLDGVTKAYAESSFHYLDSEDKAFRIVDFLTANRTEVLLTDLPDANLVDRPRAYDTSKYRHLKFLETNFTERYADVSIYRNVYPAYANDALRFSVHIKPT